MDTAHQQLTRMGIVGGIHPVALQFRKSSPQSCWWKRIGPVGFFVQLRPQPCRMGATNKVWASATRAFLRVE